MILFKWPLDEKHRWVFEVKPLFAGLSFQYRSDKLDKWLYKGRYYTANITNRWRWGRSHVYYDGPHDMFSIGYLHFLWQGDWCKKCYDEA